MVETVVAELIAVEKKYPKAPRSIRRRIVQERLSELNEEQVSEIFDSYYDQQILFPWGR